MSRKSVFSDVYALDHATHRYMIEIALDQYEDIFNEWDPAPFKRREIDADLELYLEGSAEEIPSRYPIELFFMLPQGKRNPALEEEARKAIKRFFGFKLHFLKLELRQITLRILNYLFFGFLLLWVGNTYPGHDSTRDWATLLAEGIIIGGWVFLWEAVSLFSFTSLEMYQRHRVYSRLLQAPIFFQELTHQARQP
jgi:hypothetical protein